MGKKKRITYPERGYGYYDETGRWVARETTYEKPRFNRKTSFNIQDQRGPHKSFRRADDLYRSRGRIHKSPKKSNSENRFKWRRSPSPKAGTHKYMEKRIKQMSTNIMQQIMNPDLPSDLVNLSEISTEKISQPSPESTKVQDDAPATEPKKKASKQQKSSTKKSHPIENQADVQEKIMTHLGNLREGKKKNIINVGSSNYDIAVQKIVQQRRLELSRVLRNFQSGNDQSMECMDLLNTIIPDMGISLEELPQQYIDELNRALQLEEFDIGSLDQPDEQIQTTSSEDAAILNVLDNIICKLNSNTSGPNQGKSLTEPPTTNPESTAVNLEESIKTEPTEVSNSTVEIKVEPEVDKFNNRENSPQIVVLGLEIKEEPELVESDDCILVSDESTIKETNNSAIEQDPVGVREDCLIFSDEDMEGVETEGTATTEITLNDHVRLNIINETDNSIIQHCNSDAILENRDPTEQADVSVQTENSIIAELLEERFKETPNTLQEAVEQLLEIDKWVSTLAEYREYLVRNLTKIAKEEKSDKENFTQATKKRKMETKKDTDKQNNNSTKSDEGRGNSDTVGETNISNNTKDLEPPKKLTKTNIEAIKNGTIQNSISTEDDTNTSHNENAVESPSEPNSKPTKTPTIQNYDSAQASTSHDNVTEASSKPNNKPTKKVTIQNSDGTEGNTSHKVNAIEPVLPPKKPTKKAAIQNSNNVEGIKNTSRSNEAFEAQSKPNNMPSKKVSFKRPNRTNRNAKACLPTSGDSQTVPRQSKSNEEKEQQGKTSTNINASLGKIENILQSENEVVTVVKNSREMLLVGTENGKVLIFSTKDGFLSHHLQFSRQPIKSIFCNQSEEGTFIFVLNNTVEGCNLNCETLLEDITSPREARCMDSKWGYLFIGCTAGWFMRYSIQKNACEYEDIFYGGTIGAIKALMEGVRRILLIVSLTYPVCIRDAMTGLPLRTFERCYVDSPIDTIWVQDKYLYCGGKGVYVLVLSFNEGGIVKKIKVGNNITRKFFKTYNHLLLTSDFSSNISVFNTKTGKLVKTLEGPPEGIHCMEVVVDQVFTTNRLVEFKTIPIPKELLK